MLTYAGALPFVGLAVAMALLEAPTNSTAGLWLQAYATVIISFLGGIRWGTALASPAKQAPALALSVLPALAGWIILPFATILRPGPEWYLAYAGLFALQLAWDAKAPALPVWFRRQRLIVSLIVMASLIGASAVQAYVF